MALQISQQNQGSQQQKQQQNISMKSEENDIAKQREVTMTFVFQQQQHDHKLIINAQTQKVLYVGILEANPRVKFDDVIKILQSNKFQIVEKNAETMKIKLGQFFQVEFKSKEKLIIDELRQSIKKLTIRIENQVEKNNELKEVVKDQKLQIQQLQKKQSTLKEQLRTTKETVQQLQIKVENYNHLQSQQINALKENNNLHSQKINQHSLQIVNHVELHDELKKKVSSLENTNTLITTKFETTNQEDKQKVINLTAQLTQLRTQFDHLINQTIPKCITYEIQFFRKSSIVCKSHEQLKIRGFFGNKTIMDAQLLYKASDHQFSVQKFHQKCDGIPNTLSVIWTEFDKKIGGFTPLKQASQGGGAADDSKESFIFSLKHNDKFTLQQPDYAIYNCCDYGSTFGGGHDIHVSDKANSNNISYANICEYYHNEKYKKGDKASWERFCGNPNNNKFKIREWQVWRMELK